MPLSTRSKPGRDTPTRAKIASEIPKGGIIKHFYLREKTTIINGKLHKGRPVACVVSQRINLGSLGDYIIFGVSSHNPIDRFDRREALLYAVQNLDKGVVLKIKKGIKSEIISTIAANPYLFPQRARDAAKVWLKEHSEIQP